MKPNTRRLLMSFITCITIFSMILNLIVPVADFVTPALAQEVTQEPPASTEVPIPTDEVAPPTEAPTDNPTAAATIEATAEITAQPTATNEATAEITSEPTVIPTATPSPVLFQDDFEDGNTDGWLLTAGWQLVSEPDNLFLSTAAPNETATISSISPADFALSARVRVTLGNKANIVFRAGTENYTLTFDLVSDIATLYRGAEVLGQTTLNVPAAGEDGTLPLVWYPVTILAAGGAITVTVDNLPVATYTDPTPLPGGAIIFSTDEANTGSVAIDDVVISQVMAEPELTPPVEPSVEATESATPETTSEPEITAEPIGQLLLAADFEGELSGWTLGVGGSIIADSDTNHALLLAAGANLLPTDSIYLADFRLDARLNIVSDAANGTQSGISIPFRTQDGRGYVLSIEAGQTVLYRNDGAGLLPITSSPTSHSLNTWHSLSLDASGGHLVVTLNGIIEIDVTEVEPLTNGQIAFIANSASSVMLDDIVVMDFSLNAALIPTPEPFGLSAESRGKLPSGLLDVIDLYVAGNDAGAINQARANYVSLDELNRVHVTIWAAEGDTGTLVADVVATVGGVSDYVYDDSVEARIPLGGFIALVNTPQIAAITLTSVGTSTSPGGAPELSGAAAPAGPVVGEGFDVISANDWHQVTPTALTGTGQRILVIDTGFSTLTSIPSTERSCVSNPGNIGIGNHGSQVVEVLCDIAPNSIVTIAAANTASEVNTAINAYASISQVILITMDLGVNTSSGDGTGTNASTAVSTLYTTLQTQRTNGKLVIVSAGNNNWWLDGGDRTGRYFAMTYNNGGAAINIPVNVKAGDIIRIGWNDWDKLRNGAIRENFDIKLGTRTIYDATAARLNTLDPGEFGTVTAGDCPTGFCDLVLTIGGTFASGASFGESGNVYFQVQISGEGTMNTTTGFSGATVDTNAGNIARPGDSPNVLTVGAVCARPELNFPLLRDSSIGPIFTAGGSAPAAVPTTRVGFKPDLVGPSDVSVSGNIVPDPSSPLCEDGNATGFSGTSASAAYVAAMSALIQQNSNVNIRPVAGWNALGVIDYLQSHSVDLPRNDPNGFDKRYGAGLTVLGDPAPTAPINPVSPIDPVIDGTCASFRYVKPGNISTNSSFSTMGSLANPYVHVSAAVANAPTNSCVILLPGEYVTGIYVDDTNNAGIKLRSYKSAVPTAADSIFWTNNTLSDGQGGIVVNNNSMSINGFVFKPSDPSDLCTTNPAKNVPFARPIAIIVNSSPGGNVITGNSFVGFRSGGPPTGQIACTNSITLASAPVKVTNSDGVTVQDNTFMNNDADNGAALYVYGSGIISPITVQRNLFKGNAFSGLNIALFPPTVLIESSRTNLYNNRFIANLTRSVIRIDDGSDPFNTSDFNGPAVIMFGNAFSRNQNTGPVVHLLVGRHFRFVNNTVAGSENISGGEYSAIIVRGQGNGIATTSGGTGIGGGGQFDIHNNIFYGNRSASLVKDQGAQSTCNSNGGGSNNGAQSNWSFDSGSIAGVCQVPLSAFNNNVGNEADQTGHNPYNPFSPDLETAEASEFIGEAIGGDDPYQLKGIAFGVGYADESLVNAFNAALIAGGSLDAAGRPRMSGIDGLDAGAYEYKAVIGNGFSTTIPEDYIDPNVDVDPAVGGIQVSTLPVYRITLTATGGFAPYTFAIASNPPNYSTDISNFCGGLPVRFDPVSNFAYYCAPRNFYNQGLGVTASSSFTYVVKDHAGNVSDPATVSLTISPVADTPLKDALGSPQYPYTIVGVVNSPPTEIQFRLRPTARFGNFRLSAPGDALLPPVSDGSPTAVQADYPYTYVSGSISFPNDIYTTGDNPNLFGNNRTESQNYITTQFNAIGSDGLLRLTPFAGQTGFLDFEYFARDANNNQTTTKSRVRLLVVGDLPDSGLHDDTSFTFQYRGAGLTDPGTWTPTFNDVSINNTLHITTTLNDTAEFLFDGVGFALYMQGSYSGGNYEVQIEYAGEPRTLNWQAVPGVTGLLQASTGTVTCRTTAAIGSGQPLTPTPTLTPRPLLSNYNVYQSAYVVSCNGFLDGEANKVIIINKQAFRNVSIDAIGILQNSTALLPGFHEVTEAQLLPVLYGWTQSSDYGSSGQRTAYTSSVNDDIRFTFQGRGFAIGTALQRQLVLPAAGNPLGVQYKVCVADVAAPVNKLCQKFDNGVGATTALTWNVFRPFYGFDPTKTYEVTIDVLNVPMYYLTTPLKFYIDSIVIFDTNNQPTGTLPLGVTEDDVIGPITYGGGLADTWQFDSNSYYASNKSLTSILYAAPKVGPFISFYVPAGADTVNWSAYGTLNTTQALICVDRAYLTLTDGASGNCIIMNTRTGAYQQVLANGLIANDPTPLSPSANPLVISQEMFRTGWGTAAPHIIEISSLTNEPFNLDKVQVIDSDAPLSAGFYEENSPNLRWFTEESVPSTVYTLTPVGTSGNFKDVAFYYASGGKYKELISDSTPTVIGDDKENLREGMFFQFFGTGFSVSFILDTKADAVRICWKPSLTTDISDILDELTCQTYDNQSSYPRYQAARTIAGLAQSNYSVVVQMLDDQGEPTAHPSYYLPLSMKIDGVRIYNDTTPNLLSDITKRYETSFNNSVSQGLFNYMGTGWRSLSGVYATLYSGSDYDTILNVIGAGVTFRTLNGANVVIYRDTRSGYSPMEVCVNRKTPVARRCTIIANDGLYGGYQQGITVPLFDTTEHTVTISLTDGGTFNLDAIEVRNTPFQPGSYDENGTALVYSTTTDTTKPIYSNWKDTAYTLYTGGGGMETSTIGASATFDFVGTGFSFITLFDYFSTNKVDIKICQGDCATGNNDFLFTGVNAVSNYLPSVRYGSSHSFTGLPYGNYTVTITEAGSGSYHKLLVDGIEVYGFAGDASYYDPAKTLQSGFYDDAATIGGDLRLTYGPSNGSWTSNSGVYANTSLNKTNHQTNRYGGVLTFEMNNANAFTLYHTGSTATSVRVCATLFGTYTRNCETSSLTGRNNTTFASSLLFPSVGRYYVSITNLSHGLNLFVDAIGVQNSNVLTEGIYEERNPGLTFAGSPGTWITNPVAEYYGAIDKSVRSTQTGTAALIGQTVSFTFQGIGFSIVLAEGTNTSASYSLCVDVLPISNCDTINDGGTAPMPLTPVTPSGLRRPVAITHVGFNPANTYTVTLTNNDNTKPLLIDRVDILGSQAGSNQISGTITGNVENTDPRIVYFPFFTYTDTASTFASNGSQNVGTIQGSVAYFEFDNVPAAGRAFELVRQTSYGFGTFEICSAPLNTLSTNVNACAGNVFDDPTYPNPNPILNTTLPVGYLKSQVLHIDGSNDDRWVIIRNVDGKQTPIDFIRSILPGSPLTTGTYDETHPSLQWFTENGGSYTLQPSGNFGNFTNLASYYAFGGTVRVLNEDLDPTVVYPPVNDHENLNEGMYFQFTGTGFGVGFIFDTKADAVRICWKQTATTNISDILDEPTCQIYDNQSLYIRNQAYRTILGLQQATYSVAIQMLPDNSDPALHSSYYTPLTMQIDSVKVYNDVLPSPVLNNLSTRYETSYINSTTDQSILYYGSGWRSYSGIYAPNSSGKNYDTITGAAGAGVTFRTSGANAFILYRDVRSDYTALEVCAQRTTSPFTRYPCTKVINNSGSGVSQPAAVYLNNVGYTGEQIVTMTTLDASGFVLDAIQLMDTSAPLLPGLYDDSNPGLLFTNSNGSNAGGWTTLTSYLYSGGSARQTSVSDNGTPGTGDRLRFTFTGTGFEINMGIDRFGGEVQVCYTNTATDPTFSSPRCFVYQNEAAVSSNLVTRSVAGLASATYEVRVRHIEDGISLIAPVGPRLSYYAPSRLRIDYVTIFGDSLPPVVTQGGLYNEDATNGSAPYLQLLPADRWASFTGYYAVGFSSQSYVGVVDQYKRLSLYDAGQAAVMRVQVPSGGANLIVYTGAAYYYNTDKLLVCANDVNAPAPTNPNVSNETQPGTNCTIITTLKVDNQFMLNSSKLAALGNAGTVTLTFRSLSPGQFRIDGFQLIQGNVLAPGVYDDVLFSAGDPVANPAILVGVNNVGATGLWTLAPNVATKLYYAYGGTQALAQSTSATNDDPTLRFKFAGTGFSILTTADSGGAEFTICYVALDGFDGTLDGVKASPSNALETCDVVTTDTYGAVATDWATRNNNDPNPAAGYQFGFTYTGLDINPGPGADDSYLVEVRLTDTSMVTYDRLKIDAIVVLSDVESGTPALASGSGGQIYDDTQAGILYEPSSAWKSTVTINGPLYGPWNKTEHTATNAGALVQLNVNGNGIILYQTATFYSRVIRVCLKTNLGQECTLFSQYSGRSLYFAPIAFYGFGTGDHQLVIENRDHGRIFSVDGVRVLP